VLLRAAASSPAALAGALRRYRGLLLHGADALRAGRSLGRAELREFAGELDDQLVFWELVSDGHGTLELALDDLDAIGGVLDACAGAASADAKLARLRSLLADGRPTLVFTTRRDTVRHLRDGLGVVVAWCTGDRAGLGHAPAARSAVMRWFQAPGAHPMPHCLVTTDVAAEGLDLRRAERVVHYDLPWTPMRLEQREGRAVRLGSSHPRIEVIQFPPPPALEAALRLGERLEHKAALPGQAGLGPDGARLWRWRSAIGWGMRRVRRAPLWFVARAGKACWPASPCGCAAPTAPNHSPQWSAGWIRRERGRRTRRSSASACSRPLAQEPPPRWGPSRFKPLSTVSRARSGRVSPWRPGAAGPRPSRPALPGGWRSGWAARSQKRPDGGTGASWSGWNGRCASWPGATPPGRRC
jgi:hypothetical protein